MKIEIGQKDLIRALKGYVAHMGIPLDNMEVSIDFKAGRKHPSYCVISVMEKEDSFEGVEPTEPINIVSDSDTAVQSEEKTNIQSVEEVLQANPAVEVEADNLFNADPPQEDMSGNQPFDEPQADEDIFSLFP